MKESNIDFWQEIVVGLLIENNSVVGVKTGLGVKSNQQLFNQRNIFKWINSCGRKNFGGGRSGEGVSKGITEQLESFGFESGRMKELHQGLMGGL